jgi:hypothetical protein
MGRFADLCVEIASEADAGSSGLVLPEETLARLRETGWTDGDIADALEFVHATFVQDELIEAADSLSGQLIDLLTAFDDDARFAEAAAGRARLSLDAIRRLAPRVTYLEGILAPLREGSAVDLTGLARLERRLADEGLGASAPPQPSRQRR